MTNNANIVFSRELIVTGESGGMVIFEDRPNFWDAWGTLLYTLSASIWIVD